MIVNCFASLACCHEKTPHKPSTIAITTPAAAIVVFTGSRRLRLDAILVLLDGIVSWNKEDLRKQYWQRWNIKSCLEMRMTKMPYVQGQADDM
jgi:hypothetical protein